VAVCFYKLNKRHNLSKCMCYINYAMNVSDVANGCLKGKQIFSLNVYAKRKLPCQLISYLDQEELAQNR